MKEYIKKNKFNILITLIYSIATLTVILFHESWRDEAQSWLIARDLGIIDIFKQMKYEGHPALWYLILVPFAKLRIAIYNNKPCKLDNNVHNFVSFSKKCSI